MIPVLKFDDRSAREAFALKRWSQAVVQCYEKLGININCASLHRNRLQQAGFEDIVEVRDTWPMNTWPGEDRKKLLGA